MPKFHTKKSLYKAMDKERCNMGFGHPQDIFNALAFCEHSEKFRVADLPIKTKGLQGILQTGEDFDIIMLNHSQSRAERNFYCGHELVHSIEHRDENITSFHCYESIRSSQNSFTEWQANDGSAQLILPYQDFIPCYSLLSDQGIPGYEVVHILTERYGVTSTIVLNRISTLAYEIDQFKAGRAISELEILSKRKQDELGIRATPYGAVLDFSIPWDAAIQSY